jgi:hypothetical protein
MYKIGNGVLKTQLACERAWKYWIDAKMPPPEHTHRYRRLNVPLDFEPKMDRVEEMDEFARLAGEYVKGEAQQITSIANQLVASSFYYQFDKQDLHENSDETEKGWKCKGSSFLQGDSLSPETNRCTGRVKCRLPPGSQITKDFGGLLWNLFQGIKKERKEGSRGLCFCVNETHVADFDDEDVHEIEDKVIEKMRNLGVFEMPDFEISISSAIAETNIFMVLHMEKGGLIPISGFPRNLLRDYPGNLRRDSPL